MGLINVFREGFCIIQTKLKRYMILVCERMVTITCEKSIKGEACAAEMMNLRHLRIHLLDQVIVKMHILKRNYIFLF